MDETEGGYVAGGGVKGAKASCGKVLVWTDQRKKGCVSRETPAES